MTPKFRIDPDSVRAHVRSPHIRPVFRSKTDEETYHVDLWNASKDLESLLVGSGYSSSRATNINDEFDFYMNDDIGEFRMLSFEIKNPKMATKALLVMIAEWLQTCNPDYSVFITNDYDASLELFMIVVTQEMVLGEFEERSTARALGFDSDSRLIGPIK